MGEVCFVEADGGLGPDFGRDFLHGEELVVVFLDVACFHFAGYESRAL